MSISRHEFERQLEDDGFRIFGRRYQDVLILQQSGDGLALRGHLSMKLEYPGGTTVTKVLGRNIIVSSGLDNIIRSISAQYPSSTSYQIDSFAIGNAGVTESSSLTALGNQIYTAAPTVAFTPTGQMQFSLLLAAGPSGFPGSGSVIINEAGLLASAATPKLVTYKKFSDQTLDGTVSVSLIWSIAAQYAGS